MDNAETIPHSPVFPAAHKRTRPLGASGLTKTSESHNKRRGQYYRPRGVGRLKFDDTSTRQKRLPVRTPRASVPSRAVLRQRPPRCGQKLAAAMPGGANTAAPPWTRKDGPGAVPSIVQHVIVSRGSPFLPPATQSLSSRGTTLGAAGAPSSLPIKWGGFAILSRAAERNSPV